MIQLLSSADYRQMLWKNGLGSTIELARDQDQCQSHSQNQGQEHGKELQQFLWRISMADVCSDGPFSIFPARQRLLSILDGEGLVLNFIHRGIQQTLRSTDVCAFSGDDVVESRLIAGPIRDFNLIYSAEHFDARMQKFNREVISTDLHSHAEIIFIYNHGQPITLKLDQQCYLLESGMSLKIENNDPERSIKFIENTPFLGVIVELFVK